jgi:hypothetical protein
LLKIAQNCPKSPKIAQNRCKIAKISNIQSSVGSNGIL